jgi:hypothetical protein
LQNVDLVTQGHRSPVYILTENLFENFIGKVSSQKSNSTLTKAAKMRSFQASYGLLLTILAILSSNVEAKPLSIRNESFKAPTHVIYEFPLGTWIENIAVRANGRLLVTLLNVPDLYLIDPFHANNSVLVHSFPDVLGLSGIAEVTPDIFTVSSSNFSLTGELVPILQLPGT